MLVICGVMMWSKKHGAVGTGDNIFPGTCLKLHLLFPSTHDFLLKQNSHQLNLHRLDFSFPFFKN